MELSDIREFCLSLPLVEECTPFDEDTLVFKLMGKMILAASIAEFRNVSVKCDPDKGVQLRERYAEIDFAWHFNKKHWIGVDCTGDLRDGFIKEIILESYRLVVNKMKIADRKRVLEHWPGGNITLSTL